MTDADPQAAQAEARQAVLDALTAHQKRVKQAEQALADLKAETVHYVAACRQHGPTNKPLADWRTIAAALGRKQPNVYTDYAALIEEPAGTVRVKTSPAQPEEPTMTAPASLPTITPGCTINIPERAGIHGARPVRLRVAAQRNNPDGSIHAAGRNVRANGTLGREVAVTLHPVHADRITVDSPHDDMTAGITTTGCSYSLARTGSSVYVWGESSNPREIRCDSEQDAAAKFGELSRQLAGQQP